MKKNLKKPRILLITVILLFVGYKYVDYTYFPISPDDSEKISFIVKQGESVKSIAKNLENQNLIQSNWAFYLYTRRSGMAKDIKAGRFLLSPGLAVPDIAETLTNTERAEGIVTIPEGFTIKDIDDRLTELGLIKPKEFIMYTKLSSRSRTEGYFFPDTYFIDTVNFNIRDFAERLLNTFEQKITPEMHEAIQKNKRTLDEIIIMASIIEKEVRTDEDRPKIADILWRRLDNGWMLGADATLLYEKNNTDITTEDLKSDSPYNTRKHAGLPPTPICNPGLASIQAAIYPEANNYWFYLTKPNTGEVVYAYSNEEHNKNRALYLN